MKTFDCCRLLKIAKPEWRGEGGEEGRRRSWRREKRTKIRLESSSLLDQSKLECDITIIIIMCDNKVLKDDDICVL